MDSGIGGRLLSFVRSLIAFVIVGNLEKLNTLAVAFI